MLVCVINYTMFFVISNERINAICALPVHWWLLYIPLSDLVWGGGVDDFNILVISMWTLMPFYDRVTYKRCLMVYKVKTNIVQQYLQSLTPVTSVHTHNTRSAATCALNTCTANLNYFTRSFKYESARLWNNLDNYIKFAPSIATFKQMYLPF